MDQVQHRRGLLSRGFDVIRQMFSITTDFSLLILSIILELNKEVVTKKKRRKSEPVECRQQILEMILMVHCCGTLGFSIVDLEQANYSHLLPLESVSSLFWTGESDLELIQKWTALLPSGG